LFWAQAADGMLPCTAPASASAPAEDRSPRERVPCATGAWSPGPDPSAGGMAERCSPMCCALTLGVVSSTRYRHSHYTPLSGVLTADTYRVHCAAHPPRWVAQRLRLWHILASPFAQCCAFRHVSSLPASAVSVRRFVMFRPSPLRRCLFGGRLLLPLPGRCPVIWAAAPCRSWWLA